MKTLILACLAAATLTACASPYRDALDTPVLVRPEPALTAADQRALAPYDQAPYFRGR